ncbi:hypothetical protein GALL_118280 [mine drainage metagenome]|uniref:Toxin co-regulated pilus biosynthesis protein Q C-terminal domain-containing protein n=1 Tax=mine drainage metagenome TaxID=410659 RepID=A0A1J5SCE6_9ZZZZ
MKTRQYWLFYLALLGIFTAGHAYAQFIISEDAVAPDTARQQPAPAAEPKREPSQASGLFTTTSDDVAPVTKKQEPQPAPLEKKPAKIKKMNDYRANFGNRVTIQHKGRKPAVFGKPVHAEDATLNDLVVALVPETFQVYGSDDVDMTVPVDGSDSSNWVVGMDYALKGTPYIATIDWDKKEINFSKDEKLKELEAAKVAKAAAKLEEEKKQVKTTKWVVSRDDGLLSIVLDKWCKNSNGQCVQFINQSSRDVPIDSEAEFNGTFHQCLGDLMTSIGQQVGRRFRWHLTSNNVLILTDDTIKD